MVPPLEESCGVPAWVWLGCYFFFFLREGKFFWFFSRRKKKESEVVSEAERKSWIIFSLFLKIISINDDAYALFRVLVYGFHKYVLYGIQESPLVISEQWGVVPCQDIPYGVILHGFSLGHREITFF